LLPVHQFGGLHVQFPVLGSGRGIHPFRTTADYENFLARMDGYVGWVDQSIANMRLGLEKGFVQPRVVVERVIAQLEALAVDDPKQSVFFAPIEAFPAGVPTADRPRLAKAYAEKLAGRVLPANRRLHDFLKDEYLPQARDSVAWSELPNGAEWYAYLVRYHTTTRLTPDEVHELGLAEVARLRTRMDRIRQQVGHRVTSAASSTRCAPIRRSSLPIPTNCSPAIAPSRRGCRRRCRCCSARIPKAPFEIRAVEAFRAPSEAAASYQPASADGKRPGVFYVNTHDLASRPKYAMEALYLHEAVPGHHYQISLAQEARTCRASAGSPGTRPSARAGRCMPRRWARTSASTPIRTARSVRSRPRCGAPCGWWWTPGCTPRAGPARRPSTTSAPTRRWRERHRGRGRSLHRLAGPGTRLQGRRTQDPGAASPRPGGAGPAIRHPRLPRPGGRERVVAAPVLEAKIDRWIAAQQ
jgi:hypothetical protein